MATPPGFPFGVNRYRFNKITTMPETRSQAAEQMAKNNNAEQSSPGENESSFQTQLLDMVREQQKLLEEYKERQDQRMFEIAEQLTQENRQLHSQLQQLHGRLNESEKLIAELQSKVMNVQKDLDASETRLLKVTSSMLASSQEMLKHEVFERLENSVDNREQETQKEVIKEHLHNSKLKVQNMKFKMSYRSPQYQDTALPQCIQKEMRETKAFTIKKPK